MNTTVSSSDPRTLYPTPSFPRQQQEIPGSVREMEPYPDHGENTYKGHGRLNGKVALVSGGDSGIGRAVALAYAREGASVAFTYIEETEDAKRTQNLVEEAGVQALAVKMDQSNAKECRQLIEKVIHHFGRLDILVNNAAFQQTYPSLSDIPDDEIEYAFKTNIESFFYLSRAALAFIPPGGSIINTSSIQAFGPSKNLAPYAATKAAIANFSVSLAQEAIEQGVRVNCVAPGPVWTPLIPSTMPEEKVEKFGANTLFKRPAQPAELAPLYVFLASNEASYVTGEIYGVTGGRMQV